jgi:hypothetical protein
MLLTLTRQGTTDQGTVGRAVLDTGEEWDTLELPWRGNLPLISCIPAGNYVASMTWSNRFARMLYELGDVPNRTTIRIHSGNWAGDTEHGWRTDVDGCILLGEEVGEIEGQLALLRSRIALNDFHAATHGMPFDLVIQWMMGANPEGA